MGFVVTSGTTVQCIHGSPATAIAPVPRVKVNGQPVVTRVAPHTVGSCPNTLSPCATIQWTTGATRVQVQKQALLLTDSVGMSNPPNGPASVIPGQTRVKAT